MHFTEIRLTNFGQYNGEHRIDLRSPAAVGDTNDRPVILIGGKNGAGKTTILDAVKLCLYGAAALGAGVKRSEYETYLLGRIHRQLGAPLNNTFAGVGLSFAHTVGGTLLTFDLRRMWQRKRRGVEEILEVRRNGTPLAEHEYVWWEQFLHDLWRQRRGPPLVERRHQDVGRHDERDLFSDRRAERLEFDGTQPIGRMLDERQFEMRVGAGIAMTGKVLAARREPCALQRADDHPPELRHIFGLFGEGAVADHWILRIGVDVEHRCVIEADAHGQQLLSKRVPETFGKRFGLVAGPAQRRHRRPLGKGLLQARHASAFLIDEHEHSGADSRLGVCNETAELVGVIQSAVR